MLIEMLLNLSPDAAGPRKELRRRRAVHVDVLVVWKDELRPAEDIRHSSSLEFGHSRRLDIAESLRIVWLVR
jgi:hypothetical protein